MVSICSSSSLKCNLDQRDALLRIESPIKTLLWNNVSQDCCLWSNVACDKHGNVIKLILDGYADENTLLPNSSVFELRFLQVARFGAESGEINASVPNEIGKLTELREITFYYYRGPIPSTIGSLTKLQGLYLYLTNGGGMEGNIPDSIGNLRQLTVISLEVNGLTGTIPDSLRRLTKLESLAIGSGVTGSLPSFIFDFPNLEYLSVGNNRLQGTLPRNIRPDSKLKLLFLDDNNFTGIVPAWIFTRRLERVSIQKNSFSGSIEPFPMPRVSYLVDIDLSDNLIEGIPTSLFSLKNLSGLSLDGNKLSGALDFELIGGMESLRSLSLSGNEGLTLKSSKGIVRYPPSPFEMTMNRCGLREFPNFLSSVNSLDRLSVNSNKMKGDIDFGRGWESLGHLDASNNNIGGSLMAPPPGLFSLNLSHNHFTGKIPTQYCGFTLLDLSFNNFTDCAHFKKQCKKNIMSVVC